MSLIKTIEHNPDFEPIHSKPEVERLISGDPAFKSWPQDSDKGDRVRSGVWEATPGVTHSRKGTMYEFCHILSGVIEIEEKGGKTYTYRAGDSFVLQPGFEGTWEVIETTAKEYVIRL